MNDWIAALFQQRELTCMGHCQRVEDLNLGLGWLYYGLARVIRPAAAVVIGSYRGFVPLVLGKALADNKEQGLVYFIDPSLVDDFWKDAHKVHDYFAGLGVANVRHFLMTTQQFVQTEVYRSLEHAGIVFIDGYHSLEQVRFDWEDLPGPPGPGGSDPLSRQHPDRGLHHLWAGPGVCLRGQGFPGHAQEGPRPPGVRPALRPGRDFGKDEG